MTRTDHEIRDIKMPLTGTQKAAMLLMGLDAATAAELLKGVDTEVVEELAVELAYLDASGYSSKQSVEIVRQFYNSLQAGKGFHLKSFLKEMLNSTIGDEKAEQVQSQIQDLLQKRDPFITIRSADSETIALILEDEHPQAAAVILSELPAKKSSEVLGLLREGIQLSAISRMTSCETVTSEAKARIAQMACNRLEAITATGEAIGVVKAPEQKHLKLAEMVKAVRDNTQQAFARVESTEQGQKHLREGLEKNTQQVAASVSVAEQNWNTVQTMVKERES